MKSEILLYIACCILFSSCNDDWMIRNGDLPIHCNGEITKKYMDKFDHNTPTLVINNNHTIPCEFVPNLYNAATIGDSLIKKEGELKYLLKSDGGSKSYYPMNSDLKEIKN